MLARCKLTKGWGFWFIAALFYAYEFMHRVLPSVITTDLQNAFHVNEHQLGTIGAMYFYAYAAFQLPAGVLVDKFGAKQLLVTASLFLTLGSFIFSSTSTNWIAQCSRFLIGAGSAFAFVGCLKIGAQWLRMSSFPLVVGLTNLCGTLGALMGGTPFSHLTQQMGWREAMIEVSLAGVVITLLLWGILPDKKATASIIQPNTEPKMIAGLWVVMKNKQSWLIACYGALLVAPIIALPEMWGVEYLKTAYHIPAGQASSITHTIFIGTAMGGPLIGWLATYLTNKLRFMMLSTLGALILLCIFIYGVNLPFPVLYVTLFCYGLLTANMLLCFTLICQIHPSWAQGAAIGFTNMIIMAFGGIAQDRIGWILHKLHFKHAYYNLFDAYHIALTVLPLCLVVAITLTLFMKQTAENP